ncbi:MAG TPA: hypothetical protein PK590_02070, partial [Candidatus Omnitrophota bacterium]|nr:hypothetical protein [Candidatus Omnitrophota bacterium]
MDSIPCPLSVCWIKPVKKLFLIPEKAVLANMLPHGFHQVYKKMDVMQSNQLRAQNLMAVHQMPEIGP